MVGQGTIWDVGKVLETRNQGNNNALEGIAGCGCKQHAGEEGALKSADGPKGTQR